MGEVGQMYTLPVISPGDVMSSMVTIANNTVVRI